MERRRPSATLPRRVPEAPHSSGVVIEWHGRDITQGRARSEPRPIAYPDWIGRCRMLQPGCRRFYLRWRKDKAPVCPNPRCRRRLYTLRKLRREGRLTKEEFRFEVSALEFDFVDPVPWQQRAAEYAALKARLGWCEVKAPGCRGVAVGWRKDRVPAQTGNGRAPIACGNEACWRRAAALAHRERRRSRTRP